MESNKQKQNELEKIINNWKENEKIAQQEIIKESDNWKLKCTIANNEITILNDKISFLQLEKQQEQAQLMKVFYLIFRYFE